MNCLNCGLPLSATEVCPQCSDSRRDASQRQRDSQKIIDLGQAKAAAVAAKKMPQPEPPLLNNWREQLTLKLEQLKEKNQAPLSVVAEAAVDFRDREFVKSSRSLGDSGGLAAEKPEYHPLAEKTLKKLDRAKSQHQAGGIFAGADMVDSNPAPQPVATTIPKRRRFIRSEEPERIEISLNQPTLPFEASLGTPRSSAEDSIQTGLAVAPLSERSLAGLIDGVFVFGCFLIFLLVVLFVPDFAFFSASSFLGMSIVLFLTFTAYVLLFTALCHQTLGMTHQELKVVTFRGSSLCLRDSSLRSFGYVVSMGCFGLGFLWALFDPEKLTWHDKISKTLIIRTPPPLQ